jgi:predicted permease
MMMGTKAIYRALLHCYPAAFRQEYGDQMLLMFAEQLGEARRTGDRLEQAALWVHATLDALIIAPREHWHVILQDLRYALRTMAARPSFPAVAILSLALGIGANTAIFSLWNGVLHSALPAVDKPEQLVMLSNPDDSGGWTGRWNGRTDGPRSWLTYDEFEQFRDHADAFSALMASQSSLNTWRVRYDDGAWEEARGRLVSGGFFQVLGVKPAIGRLFTTAEDRVEAPFAVISHSYWRRRFGASPDVLGKIFTLQKTALTIIGVTPPGFVGETSGQQPDLWLPLRMQPGVPPGRDMLHDSPPVKRMWLQVFGRLKPGVTLPEAEAQTNAIFQAGLESFYGAAASGERRREFLDQHIRIQPGAMGASPIRKEFHHSLTALLASVGLLLLIACANLANLLLARNAARKHEIAVRVSLGASRERLIRQLVTESLLLAAMGGVAAIAVAWFLHAASVRMVAESDPRFQMNFTLDPLVLAFLVGATLAAGLLFGVLPALQVTRSDARASMNEQGRSASSSPGEIRSGRLLVSLQLALSLPLLTGAGLLARTVYNLQRADLGFQTEHLLLTRVDLREVAKEAPRPASLADELLGELRRIPGIRAASFSQLGVFSGGESSESIEVEGYTPKGGSKEDDDRGSALDVVGPDYFSTLGIPILLGREILESDRGDASRVCVINEAFAKRFFSGRSPVGKRITSVSDDSRTAYQVVGVARNAHTQGLRGNVEPRFFVAFHQRASPAGSPIFLIRAATETGTVMRAVRKAIQSVEPALPILHSTSIEEQMAPLMAQDRTTAQLAVVFGCVALALAAIGLYGVLSYGVARRTGEIAIRIALGARPGRVVSMILRETFGLVAAGLAMGGGLAYGVSRLIDSRLYGVAPQDPLTLAAATGLLLLVALSAAYLPARRASRVDPMVALRQG